MCLIPECGRAIPGILKGTKMMKLYVDESQDNFKGLCLFFVRSRNDIAVNVKSMNEVFSFPAVNIMMFTFIIITCMGTVGERDHVLHRFLGGCTALWFLSIESRTHSINCRLLYRDNYSAWSKDQPMAGVGGKNDIDTFCLGESGHNFTYYRLLQSWCDIVWGQWMQLKVWLLSVTLPNLAVGVTKERELVVIEVLFLLFTSLMGAWSMHKLQVAYNLLGSRLP